MPHMKQTFGEAEDKGRGDEDDKYVDSDDDFEERLVLVAVGVLIFFASNRKGLVHEIMV